MRRRDDDGCEVESIGRDEMVCDMISGERSGRIGVVVPDLDNPFNAALVASVEGSAESHGQLVLSAATGHDEATEAALLDSMSECVDGFVLCMPLCSTRRLRRLVRGRPMILVNRRALGSASVVIAQERVVSLAVAHLRELGHDRIVGIVGPTRHWMAVQRIRAFSSEDVMVLSAGVATWEGGRDVTQALIDAGATAAVVYNDPMALGLLAGLSIRDIAVPAEVSLVGADDIAMAGMAYPGLTTVAAASESIGASAFDLYLDALGGEPPSERTIMPHLVVRGTTASPRGVAVDDHAGMRRRKIGSILSSGTGGENK